LRTVSRVPVFASTITVTGAFVFFFETVRYQVG